MGFVLRENFWTDELQAPLLDRNCGFLNDGQCAEICERATQFASFCDLTNGVPEHTQDKDIASLERIFAADAERTFKSDSLRKDMVKILQRLGRHYGDYHQGMGYVTSFLCLLLDTDTVFNIMIRMGDPKYMQGYFRGTPETLVRDALVLERLMHEHQPETAAHLRTNGVVPEAYVSKWFVGLSIHVLPFDVLFEFFEQFLQNGSQFLFQFGLSIIQHLSPQLLAAKNDVSRMFALLRLDPTLFPSSDSDQHPIFRKALETAKTITVDPVHVEELRKEEWVKLQERLERVRQREKELADDDDEIVFSDESDAD